MTGDTGRVEKRTAVLRRDAILPSDRCGSVNWARWRQNRSVQWLLSSVCNVYLFQRLLFFWNCCNLFPSEAKLTFWSLEFSVITAFHLFSSPRGYLCILSVFVDEKKPAEPLVIRPRLDPPTSSIDLSWIMSLWLLSHAGGYLQILLDVK